MQTFGCRTRLTLQQQRYGFSPRLSHRPGAFPPQALKANNTCLLLLIASLSDSVRGGGISTLRLWSFGNRREVARLAATTKNSGDIYYSKAVLVYKEND